MLIERACVEKYVRLGPENFRACPLQIKAGHIKADLIHLFLQRPFEHECPGELSFLSEGIRNDRNEIVRNIVLSQVLAPGTVGVER
ncbi:hypothetical protein LAL4801_00681 [Roseibium aggregatum]|uniref:Uncharacterized protein n=1 Tax=Roseibium aggregatum TaxID=187304 RepID=A0A0M6XZ30_9HYPH|nr:hypothetical protein LAL4801_00681 [Roseibium aggregatum]